MAGRTLATIDARAAARQELGGVERWARELVERLPRLRPGAYDVAWPPRGMDHRLGHLWEQTVLPVRAARAGGLLLCPANLAPIAGRRNVVVLHDVAPLRDPSWYSPTYVRVQRVLLPRIAHGALALIVPSHFVRQELVSLLGADAGKITVVGGGVDERFSPAADPGPARAALGLDGPYVLTIASRTARKNLDALGPGQSGRVIAEKKVSVVGQQVEELLGYGSDQFRQIVLLPQGKFETFLAAKTDDRVKILRDLFDVTIYRNLAARLKEEASEAERALREQRSLYLARLVERGFESVEAL